MFFGAFAFIVIVIAIAYEWRRDNKEEKAKRLLKKERDRHGSHQEAVRDRQVKKD